MEGRGGANGKRTWKCRGIRTGIDGEIGGGGWKIKEIRGEICIVLTENV